MFYRVSLIPSTQIKTCEYHQEDIVCLDRADYIFQTDFLFVHLCQHHLNEYKQDIGDNANGELYSDESIISRLPDQEDWEL